MKELERIVDGDKDVGCVPTGSSCIVESPCEGLVALGSNNNDGLSLSHDRHIDPVYGLVGNARLLDLPSTKVDQIVGNSNHRVWTLSTESP